MPTDHYATWDDPVAWWPRLIAEVITPLQRGWDAHYRPLVWRDGTPRPGPEVRLPWAPLIVIEGVSSARRRSPGSCRWGCGSMVAPRPSGWSGPWPATARRSARTCAAGRSSRPAGSPSTVARALRVSGAWHGVGMDGATEDLQLYLDRSRDVLIWKLEGLGEYDLRRPITATGTNLLGLVKHCAMVDSGYLGGVSGVRSSTSTSRIRWHPGSARTTTCGSGPMSRPPRSATCSRSPARTPPQPSPSCRSTPSAPCRGGANEERRSRCTTSRCTPCSTWTGTPDTQTSCAKPSTVPPVCCRTTPTCPPTSTGRLIARGWGRRRCRGIGFDHGLRDNPTVEVAGGSTAHPSGRGSWSPTSLCPRGAMVSCSASNGSTGPTTSRSARDSAATTAIPRSVSGTRIPMIDYRLGIWRAGMEANLEGLRALVVDRASWVRTLSPLSGGVESPGTLPVS